MVSLDRNDALFLERYGPWVLVVGASEGTGAEFALQAAGKGANVILVARRPDKLEELGSRIAAECGVEVVTRSLDLAGLGAAAALQEAAEGKDVGLVIFNAGGDNVGGRFLDSSHEQWATLVQRNIGMLTEACHRFATMLAGRGRGGLLLVGSDAAFGGVGRLAVYTATKGYALNMGESLWRELKPHGVDVLNVVIGATDTPKLRSVLQQHGVPAEAMVLTSARDVARIGLSKLGAGPTVVLGAPAESDDTLTSAKLRRERVTKQSEFMTNFYGPE